MRHARIFQRCKDPIFDFPIPRTHREGSFPYVIGENPRFPSLYRGKFPELFLKNGTFKGFLK